MGIGFLRVIDRDIVEKHNLVTQFLFDELDAAQTRPKALAAKRHLELMNSECEIEAIATSISSKNVANYVGDVDLIVDATDNFDTRFIVNDFTVKGNIPWLYTGVVGYNGITLLINPQETACLSCLMDVPPVSGELPTCETEGVWTPVAQTIVALGLNELTAYLVHRKSTGMLHTIDFLENRQTSVLTKRKNNCSTCGKLNFQFLEGNSGYSATSLCGREIVHILPEQNKIVDMAKIAQRLSESFKVIKTEELLRIKIPEGELYLFADGRALVKGVSEPDRARALYDRYIGS